MNLEARLAAWRQSMQAAGIGPGERRDELESHLRESFEGLVRAGMTEEDAFRTAAEKLGPPAAIQQEFNSAGTLRSRMRRVLTEPVRVFPSDLTVCAWCSLPTGIYTIGCAFKAVFDTNRRAADLTAAGWYDLHELSIDLAIFALVALVGLRLVLPGLRYIRTKSLVDATSLAAIWPVIFWIFGNVVMSAIAPYAPGSQFLRTLYVTGFLSFPLAYVTYRFWKKKLLAGAPVQAG